MGKKIKQYTEHGMGMYRYRRCRCEICSEAMAQFRKQYRKNADGYNKPLDATPLLDWLKLNDQMAQVDRNTAKRWAEVGVSVYTVDSVCIRLGVHPVEVYGNRFYEGCFNND